MVMTYSHAKVQGQLSVGSEDGVERNGWTDGRTDGGDCVTSHANEVVKNRPCLLFVCAATVVPVNARVRRPGDDATVVCNVTGPTTETVTAWFRNASDGTSFKLPHTDATKYRQVTNDTLTVLKVGQ